MIPMVILCGGLSTRLHSLTKDKPKSMVHVMGIPFIDHQLGLMRDNDVKEVILCTGQFGDQIKSYVRDGSKWGLSVSYSEDGEMLLGTGGALKNAYDILPERFIVINGDSYLDINYNKVLNKFRDTAQPLLMTVFPVDNDSYKNVYIDDRGFICKYDKSGKYSKLNYIDYGFTPMKKYVLERMPDGAFDFSEIYSNSIERGCAAYYISPKIFHEMGSFEGLEETKDYIRRKMYYGTQ